MNERPLARLAAPTSVFDRMLSFAPVESDVDGEPYYDEMLLRVDGDSLRTPAGNADAPLAAYCAVTTDLLDSVDHRQDAPVTAVFDIGELHDRLAWVDDGDADGVSVRFDGDPSTGRASRTVVSNREATAGVDCVDDAGLLAVVALELPDRSPTTNGSSCPTATPHRP